MSRVRTKQLGTLPLPDLIYSTLVKTPSLPRNWPTPRATDGASVAPRDPPREGSRLPRLLRQRCGWRRRKERESRGYLRERATSPPSAPSNLGRVTASKIWEPGGHRRSTRRRTCKWGRAAIVSGAHADLFARHAEQHAATRRSRRPPARICIHINILRGAGEALICGIGIWRGGRELICMARAARCLLPPFSNVPFSRILGETVGMQAIWRSSIGCAASGCARRPRVGTRLWI